MMAKFNFGLNGAHAFKWQASLLLFTLTIIVLARAYSYCHLDNGGLGSVADLDPYNLFFRIRIPIGRDPNRS